MKTAFLGYFSVFAIVSAFCFWQADSEPIRDLLKFDPDFNKSGIFPLDFTCYDIHSQPYIKDVPHPNNCNFFLQCEERAGSGPRAVVAKCYGSLHFSLKSCRCEQPNEAICFEEVHEPIRMKCACPLIEGPNGNLVPDINDPRCQ